MNFRTRFTTWCKKTFSELYEKRDDDATIKLAIVCGVVVTICVTLGVVLQNSLVGPEAKLIAKCKKNPKYRPECAEILLVRGTPSPHDHVRKLTETPKAPFQLSGPDDDLTPPPPNSIFRE